MSFLKRLTQTSGRSGSATIEHPAGTSTGRADEPCAHPGCANRDSVNCAYIDRRERPCGYAWCPDHQVRFEGQPYCRRHGGVMHAIATNTVERIHPPDLDNRALSLCEWVSNDLDADIRALLEARREGAPGLKVQPQPLHLVLLRLPTSRAWARVWTLSDHTGTLLKVGIEVNENDDTIVVATVDGNPVAKDVPPWISDRGTPISDDAVQKRRDQFRVRLVEALVTAAESKYRPWI
jgi:hypothetical protein